jgi:hypothetical protein
MAPLAMISAGVALIWPALAYNELVISGAALIVACDLARLPSRLTLPAVGVMVSAAVIFFALR